MIIIKDKDVLRYQPWTAEQVRARYGDKGPGVRFTTDLSDPIVQHVLRRRIKRLLLGWLVLVALSAIVMGIIELLSEIGKRL